MPRCFAEANPMFQPAMRLIAGITNANPAVVTTTFDHLYVDGTNVRLDVPEACGMTQINTLNGIITIIDATSFSIPIDSTLFTPFVAPDPNTTNPHTNICAMVVPIGEDAFTLEAAVRNTLPH